MAIWIASGNRQNWEVMERENIWGIPKRSKKLHSQVKIGDSILLYVRSETKRDDILPSAIMGEYVVTDLYEDSQPIFTTPPQMGDEVFPYRYRLKPKIIFKQPVEIRPLIPELEFIKNKKMWFGYFRQPIRGIPVEDYKRILKSGSK